MSTTHTGAQVTGGTALHAHQAQQQAPSTAQLLATVTPAQARALATYSTAAAQALQAHLSATRAQQAAQACRLRAQAHSGGFSSRYAATRATVAGAAADNYTQAHGAWRKALAWQQQAKACAVLAGVPAGRVHALALALATRRMGTGA